MKVFFMGSQSLGHRCLEQLLSMGEEVAGVMTFRPEPHETWELSVDDVARKRDIPLYYSEELDSAAQAALVERISPDVIFVACWRRIIHHKVYQYPSRGVIGFHYSLFPKYRGHCPLNWAIINGESETGVTAFYVNEGTDIGDILAQRKVSIQIDDNVASLRVKLEDAAVDILREYVPLLREGRVAGVRQDFNSGSYGCPRGPGDGLVDWTRPAEQVHNLIRATSHPLSGAFTYHEGRRLYLWESSLKEPGFEVVGSPGQVALINKGTNVFVLTGRGIVSLEEVQLEGEEPSKAGNYFKGIRTRLGIDFVAEYERLNRELMKLKEAVGSSFGYP